MWELIATAVAGLNAGAGLQVAIAGAPSVAADSMAFTRFAGRSRMLSMLLSTVATSSCLTAFYGESRGTLWLAAAAGTGLLIPFNLLMMAPPTAVVASSMGPRVRFAGDEAAGAEGALGGGAGEEAAGAAMADPQLNTAFANGGGGGGDRAVLSAATASPQQPAIRGRRPSLVYAKSGMLVSPSDFAASWSRKFWFSAALSLTAFGCMMCMVGSGKDAVTYGYAPY